MANNSLIWDLADCTSKTIIKKKKPQPVQPKTIQTNNVRYETLAILDSRVPEIDHLYAQLCANTIGYTVAPAHDALMVITLLLGETRANKLMIVVNDQTGMLQLGALPLDRQQLRAKSALLQEWAIKEVTFYSANMAVDPEFIAEFAKLTGAKVTIKSGLPQLD
jgi:hypothetical protein